MRMAMGVAIVMATVAHAQDGGAELEHWDVAAKFWIAEVAEPELDRCVALTGGRGRVTIELDVSGNVYLSAKGADAGLARCVELVAAKWSATAPPQRYGGVRVTVTYPSATPESFEDPYPWREPHQPFGKCSGSRDCGAGEICDVSLNNGVCVDLVAALRDRARRSNDVTPPEMTLTGEFAAAISIAAERVLGPRANAKACLARLESRFVHVARDGGLITVDFSPNDRCGTSIRGGGAHVVLDAKTLKIENVTLHK